jgi:hypothetical protein
MEIFIMHSGHDHCGYMDWNQTFIVITDKLFQPVKAHCVVDEQLSLALIADIASLEEDIGFVFVWRARARSDFTDHGFCARHLWIF